MGRNIDICTRVMTYHRSVAHMVEGLCFTFFILLFVLGLGNQNRHFLVFLIYGITECVKGILLLVAIFKESRKQLLVYSVINILTLLIKHGLIINVAVVTLPFEYHIHWSLLWVSFVVIYVVYEWFMVYSVFKIRQSLQSMSHEGDKEVQFHYKQHKDDSVDIIT